MITAILAFCHAMSRNPKFQPGTLYFGTFLIDMQILTVVAKHL